MTIRVAVMASGRGSNFKALIDARAAGELPGAEVALLIGGVTSPTIAGGRGCADSEAVRRMHLAGVARVGAGVVLTYERE